MIKSLQRSFSSFPKQHLIPKSGTYPLGYYVNSIASGIKKNASKDLTIITSPNHPCTVSGVFTLNAFAAAPVQVCRSLLSTPENRFNSLIVNSGCANACTGEIGLKNSWETVKLVDAAVSEKFNAGKLSKQISSSLVCSTGVIGQQLPMDVIVNGVKPLVEGVGSLHEDWLKVAVGVMTTDTFPKLRSKEVVLPNGAKFRMAGWCKGAGMIHPNMATLLSAVFIDADVSKECLDVAVKHAVDRSFNAISVDGDTSTNDTFLVYANGAGDAAAVIEDVKSPMFKFFVDELTKFSSELSKLIVRDGEGATKLIDIVVRVWISFIINFSTFCNWRFRFETSHREDEHLMNVKKLQQRSPHHH
ncbi:hypothetical protein HK098_007568 [Nowakowskiella sp. JEL0407]|nr:hypothetical protein HK098_007568 [Nowakowskiella sp. JEL0407]